MRICLHLFKSLYMLSGTIQCIVLTQFAHVKVISLAQGAKFFICAALSLSDDVRYAL